MAVTMMIEYQGRYMTAEEVYELRHKKETVIENTDIQEEPTEEITTVEEITEPTEEITTVEDVTENNDEFEKAVIEYEKIFKRKPNGNIKLETLLEKIAKASEV